MGAVQGTLEVAQESIDSAELLQRRAGLAASGDHALVVGADQPHGAEAPQAIRGDGGRRSDGACGELSHAFIRERLLGQAPDLRPAVWRCLHRCDERHLVLRAVPGLATRALPAQVGVVDLHPNVEVARQLRRGNVVLGLGQQMQRQEPARQRQFGAPEDRAADEAALVPAGRALEVQPPFAAKRTAVAAAARRARKSARPARLDQRRLALVITASSVHELGHRQPRLNLHLHSIHLHDPPPVAVIQS